MGSSCAKPQDDVKTDSEIVEHGSESKTTEVSSSQELIKKLEVLKEKIDKAKVSYSEKIQTIITESKGEFENMKKEPFLKDVYIARLKMLKRRKDNSERYHKMLTNVLTNLQKTIEMIKNFESNKITAEFVNEHQADFRNIYRAVNLVEDLNEMTREQDEVKVYDTEFTAEDEEDFKKFMQEVDPSINTAEVDFRLSPEIENLLPQVSPITATNEAKMKEPIHAPAVLDPPPFASNPPQAESKVLEAEIDY